jgi:hypothetical protein
VTCNRLPELSLTSPRGVNSGTAAERKSHVFQCLVNGTTCFVMSCQFGTIFADPAVPHSLQTRRRPIFDHGKS